MYCYETIEKMFLLIIAKRFSMTMTMCGFDKNGDQTEGMSEMTREGAC